MYNNSWAQYRVAKAKGDDLSIKYERSLVKLNTIHLIIKEILNNSTDSYTLQKAEEIENILKGIR